VVNKGGKSLSSIFNARCGVNFKNPANSSPIHNKIDRTEIKSNGINSISSELSKVFRDRVWPPKEVCVTVSIVPDLTTPPSSSKLSRIAKDLFIAANHRLSESPDSKFLLFVDKLCIEVMPSMRHSSHPIDNNIIASRMMQTPPQNGGGEVPWRT